MAIEESSSSSRIVVAERSRNVEMEAIMKRFQFRVFFPRKPLLQDRSNCVILELKFEILYFCLKTDETSLRVSLSMLVVLLRAQEQTSATQDPLGLRVYRFDVHGKDVRRATGGCREERAVIVSSSWNRLSGNGT